MDLIEVSLLENHEDEVDPEEIKGKVLNLKKVSSKFWDIYSMEIEVEIPEEVKINPGSYLSIMPKNDD